LEGKGRCRNFQRLAAKELMLTESVNTSPTSQLCVHRAPASTMLFRMPEVLGVTFQNEVLPLVEKLIGEAQRLGGEDCVYAVAIPEIRAAIIAPELDRDAEGVFLRITPSANGATVSLRKAMQNGLPRALTVQSISTIQADLPIWYEQIKAGVTATKGSLRGGVRNPAWTRDELILALEQYFETPPWTINGKHPAIAALSGELGRLSAYTDAPDRLRYRNANGVYMKLMNLQYHDPSRDGRGLKGGGSLEPVIWQEYGADREKLRLVARAIRIAIDSGSLAEVLPDPTDVDYAEAPEGRILTRIHRVRERDSKLRASKKASVLAATGKLDCEACNFNFSVAYGDHGADFIEVHHLTPLHELPEHTKTKLEDLALLCSNCHRMVHRQRQWLSLGELRALLKR